MPGIFLRSDYLGNKKNRTTLLLAELVANGVHATVASALAFQPARPAALNLTRHAPACDFISTPSHTTLFACQKLAPHYKDFSPQAKSDLLRKRFRPPQSARKLL